LRELLDEQELDLGEVGFALRLEQEPKMREAIEQWLAAQPARLEHVCWPIGDLFDLQSVDWLRFEQEKHQRLLLAAAPITKDRLPATTTMEIA
jgi:hypothetical protein